MMTTQGWSDLIEDVENMVKATSNIDSIDDLSKLWFKKGELSIMKWLLSLRELTESAYKELNGEDA